jgi:hypothetical protein
MLGYIWKVEYISEVYHPYTLEVSIRRQTHLHEEDLDVGSLLSQSDVAAATVIPSALYRVDSLYLKKHFVSCCIDGLATQTPTNGQEIKESSGDLHLFPQAFFDVNILSFSLFLIIMFIMLFEIFVENYE